MDFFVPAHVKGNMRQTPLMPALGPEDGILARVRPRDVMWLSQVGDPIAKVPNYTALVRWDSKEPRPVAIVSRTYKLVEMWELLYVVEEAILKVHPTASPATVEIRDKVIEHGKTCVREYIFKDVRQHIGAKGEVALRIVVANSYGGSAIKILGGAIDYYCSNGLVTGSYDSAYYRHSKGFTLSKIDDNIVACIEAYRRGVTKWQQWTQTHVTRDEVMQLFRRFASSDRAVNKLVLQYEKEARNRGDNLWSVVSALTHYATHGKVKATTAGTEEATRFKRELAVSKWMDTAIPSFMQRYAHATT